MRLDRKVLFLGFGAVAQCTLPSFLNHFEIPRNNITIIDLEDKSGQLKPFTDSGIKFYQEKVTPETLDSILSEHIGDNGLLIDLAWNIGATDILQWAHDHNTLYVNTSVELWDPYAQKTVFEKTLYWRQMKLREMSRDWKDSATAVIDHGANPGLISHFAKQGLLDISERLIGKGGISGRDLEELVEYKNNLDFAHLAQKLGVRVIHCSERDTQIANKPKEVNEFVNTWSVAGFHEEGTAPAEMGWGTHEKKLPELAYLPPYGPMNQIFLARMGINTRARSFVPEVGEIEGMIVRHGEAYGLSKMLTLKDKNGTPVYRPTVHYVYMPCHDALASLDELRARNYEYPSKSRIMTNEIISGKDNLGALIMGHMYNSWWTGSILSIEESRKICPMQNATTLQVAGGVISAAKWVVENPNKGLCVPEDIPHDYVLKTARHFIGEFHSQPYDWTPLQNRQIFFPENPDNKPDSDTWQFHNFRPLP